MVKAPATTVLCNNPDNGTPIVAAMKAGPKSRVEAPRAHVGVQYRDLVAIWCPILWHPEDGDSNMGELTAQSHIPRVILLR